MRLAVSRSAIEESCRRPRAAIIRKLVEIAARTSSRDGDWCLVFDGRLDLFADYHHEANQAEEDGARYASETQWWLAQLYRIVDATRDDESAVLTHAECNDHDPVARWSKVIDGYRTDKILVSSDLSSSLTRCVGSMNIVGSD